MHFYDGLVLDYTRIRCGDDVRGSLMTKLVNV